MSILSHAGRLFPVFSIFHPFSDDYHQFGQIIQQSALCRVFMRVPVSDYYFNKPEMFGGSYLNQRFINFTVVDRVRNF